MEEIYQAEPIWRDMYNIFRHFAVARVMKDRDAFARAGLASDWLLHRYELPRVALPASLPGLDRVDGLERKCSFLRCLEGRVCKTCAPGDQRRI
jgi:hypothetical protein